MLNTYCELRGKSHNITIPAGKTVKVKIIGTIKLGNGLVLKDVLYVPNFHLNLVSIPKLITDLASIVYFTKDACILLEAFDEEAFASW